MTTPIPTPIRWACALACALPLFAAAPAHAAWLDSLFGKSDTANAPAGSAASSKQRNWRIGEFTSLQLAPREAGTPPNDQPAQISGDALRRQLALVRFGDGAGRPLFAADELGELVEPLVQALSVAGPGDDLLLVSSSRRDGGILMPPTAVTARLFVQGGALQVIVHDARFDFYDKYRGTSVAPTFVPGSRTAATSTAIRSEGAANRRGDWLAIPMGAGAAAAPPPPPPPPVGLAAPAAAGLAATPAAPAAAPAPRPLSPREPGFAEDVEQRLLLLKRLRDKGLISEPEYEQKRAEILKLL